jgi:outer membrane protein OmpA-like peptidoglycan-associated protein
MNKATGIIFIGIIILGTIISLIYLNTCGKPKVDPVDPPVITPVEPVAVTEPSSPEPVVAPSKDDEIFFTSPEAAMAALAGRVGAKDYDGLVALTRPGAVADSLVEPLKTLVNSPEVSVAADKPAVEISKSADSLRWALNLLPGTGALPAQLFADLSEVPQANPTAYTISGLSLPLAVTRSVAGEATPDALTVAHSFAQAVVAKDFHAARALSAAKLTDEKLAALVIAVEEGKFALKEERPLVVTLSREDITWVLARLQSAATASEFAVELGQGEGSWKVDGLTFSKLLADLGRDAGATAYTPIVEDPAGGDSLVVFFEFNDSGITPRAGRQLEIIAKILKEDKERIIRINGHTDALGPDEYNVGLSTSRAEAVRQALIGIGVAPDQVVTEAFGAERPLAPNFLPDGTDNPTGRTQNRRAEVYLDF